MSASILDLISELQPYANALVNAAASARLVPQVTSTLRSRPEQERLYRRYLAGQQPYPVARPGRSAHEYGYAFDLIVSPMSRLYDVGALWESWGGIWGGNPRHPGSKFDPVHFEYPGFSPPVIAESEGAWHLVQDALGALSWVFLPLTTDEPATGFRF